MFLPTVDQSQISGKEGNIHLIVLKAKPAFACDILLLSTLIQRVTSKATRAVLIFQAGGTDGVCCLIKSLFNHHGFDFCRKSTKVAWMLTYQMCPHPRRNRN